MRKVAREKVLITAFKEFPHIVAGYASFEDDRAIYMVQACGFFYS